MEKPGNSAGARLSTAFLLTQVGSRAASLFADRLSHLELSPPHAGILRAIATTPGLSQQTLAQKLGMVPSRLVAYLDELESRTLIQRGAHPEDRRQHALELTKRGHQTLTDIAKLARAHDDAVCGALTGRERDQLAALLSKIADAQGLTPGVHPGFAKIGEAKGPAKRR